ncbi:MAG: SNF2-related protein, partial [Verrucomicrobiales bacterium]|nr:SNF2-related protein [Verrucomicrobiales bacterium]
MQVFAIGQRWVSESEPELGLGLIHNVNDLRVDVLFPATHEKRQYAIDNTPLKRVRFKPGDVINTPHGAFPVDEVLSNGRILSYRSAGTILPEAEISGSAAAVTPLDRLLAGDIDETRLFSLRLRTLEMQQKILQSPARGFVGARVDLIPHQLYIAHEGASRRAPRLLLADEVGLGKTIEAGLILHRLLLTGRAQRILILVPEPLVNQWFVEMLRKFNLWFSIYDEERCKALEANNPDSNPFLDDQLIICGMDVLGASDKRVSQAENADWDLLVVDEAHHLEWAPNDPSPEYRAAEAIAGKASGILLLTATPDQSAAHHGSSKELLQGHFARLRLLDPARYFDFEVFTRETAAFSALSDMADRVKRGEPLDKKQLINLAQLIPLDDSTRVHLQTRTTPNDLVRARVIDEILDRHGPGRVTFRNTRAGIGGFPKRVPRPVPLQANSDDQLDTINAEVALEFYPPEEIPEFDFKNDPRIRWLIDFLRTHPKDKIL